MADFIPNVAKGKINGFHDRVNDNDPATATLVVVVIETTATDAVLEDLDDLAAILANGLTAEVTNTNYTRKVLTDTDIGPSTVDDSANERASDIPDQTWTSVVAGDNWTDLIVCYDAASGADSTLIPLAFLDFIRTPDGNDIVALMNAGGYQKAA